MALWQPDARTLRLERWAGAFSMVAGGVHGFVTPQHFEEWWGYGLFFMFAAAAQFVFGLALLARAVDEKPNKWDPRAARKVVYGLGIGGNLAIIAMWVVTRTVGIPFFGPGAGKVEVVGGIDLFSKVVEATLVVLLVVLGFGLRRHRGARGQAAPA